MPTKGAEAVLEAYRQMIWEVVCAWMKEERQNAE